MLKMELYRVFRARQKRQAAARSQNENRSVIHKTLHFCILTSYFDLQNLAYSKNSRLPSAPSKGDSITSVEGAPNSKTTARTRSTAACCASGSRTMPPLPTF